VLGNASRVTVLSYLVLGARAPDLAGLLHVPLGVLVFLAAAVAAVPVLGVQAAAARPTPARPGREAPAVALIALVTALAGGGLRAARHDVEAGPRRPATLTVATSMTTDADDVALSPAEEALYGRHALHAGKRRLRDDEGREIGEVLVVVTDGLRAIHAPERCLAGSGHAVVASDVVVRAGVPVKRLVLDGGRAVGLSFLRSARGRQATDLGDVALARLGVDGPADAGPWVFVSAVVATDRLTASVEEALVARLVGHAATLHVTLQPGRGSPP
jgi:hypothetical protein